MTKEQAQKANNRIVVLEDRIQNFNDNIIRWGINQEKESSLYINLVTTMTEFQLEIKTLKDALNTRHEWLFNFKNGGWNSEMAFTKEEAIEQAIFKYGHPDTQEMLQVDTTTFRVSTTVDHKNLMSMFY